MGSFGVRFLIFMEVLAWVILGVLSLTGLIGTILPFLPGAVIILVGAVLHKMILPGALSWWMIGFLIFLVLIERLVDFLGSVVGARWLGATRWGIIGAALGTIVGLFFGLIGLIIGPILGAFVGEIVFAKREIGSSAKAGVGAGLGIGIATLARFAVALLMIALIAFDLIA